MAKSKSIRVNKVFRSLSSGSTISFSIFVTSVLVLFLWGIRQSGNLQFLELAAFDLMMRWSVVGLPEEELVEPRITIVKIDESDIQAWQQSTFSDELIARLISELQKHNPKVIGLDIYRDLPQPPGNKKLLKQLAADNVVGIAYVSKDKPVPAPPNLPPERIGFNNLLLDDDATVRRNFLAAKLDDRRYYSFALQLSKKYLEISDISLDIKQNYLKLERTIFPVLQANSGSYQLADSDVFGSQILLKYQPLETITQQVSFTEIIEGNFQPSWIENKVVIIGYSAPSKKDIFSTPYGIEKMPGVAIHAQMANQILSTALDQQPLFGFLPQWGEFVWIWSWSIAGTVLVWRTRHPLTLGVGLTVGVLSLLGICFGGFLAAIWIPVVPSAIGLIGTTGAILAYKTFYKSVVDELTGLANHEGIIALLQQSLAKPKNSSIAVISIRIEHFKTISNNLGKSIGDRLIVLTGQRIQNCIRDRDKLARAETAQFVLTLLPLENRNIAIAIAERIQRELAQIFQIKEQEVLISTSLGIAFSDSEKKINAEELIRNSNIAQDRACHSGKNQYAIFTTKMLSESIVQWQLEKDLRQAIAAQEFELYYQPIIDLKSDRVAGFEALVRWISPTRGFVSPGEFIPLAEATELIIPLGDWILRQACEQMYRWHQQFENKLTISVNLSSQQFSHNLVPQIEQILKETKLAPECLKLEITESAMMDNVGEAIALLQQLKALSIKLSIDDFGTGYSSLSYLQQFCADTLKVDQSFVRQMELSDRDRAIVDIIITLAHKLDMNVIAEGIETKNHEQMLKALNCEYGQGYLFAKPLRSEDARDLLAASFLIDDQ